MGRIFGAYTDISQSSDTGYKDGNGNTFIFSLRDDINFVKLKCLDKKKEVFHRADYFTCIGYKSNGFHIANFCDKNQRSSSYLGKNG